MQEIKINRIESFELFTNHGLVTSPEVKKILIGGDTSFAQATEKTGRTLLLARKFLLIGGGGVVVAPDIKNAFAPLNSFSGIVQFVRHNERQHDAVTIFNIFVSDSRFLAYTTAGEDETMVFFAGTRKEMNAFILGEMRVAETHGTPDPRGAINAKTLSTIIETGRRTYLPKFIRRHRLGRKWHSSGITHSDAERITKCVLTATTRGAVTAFPVNPQTVQSFIDNTASGHGFLYVTGDNDQWLFPYESTADDAVLQIVPCTAETVNRQLNSIPV